MIKLITKTIVSYGKNSSLFSPCEMEEIEEWIEIQKDEQSPVFTFNFGSIVWIEDGQFSNEGKIDDVDIKNQRVHIERDFEDVCICDVCWDEDERPFFKAVEFINYKSNKNGRLQTKRFKV